MNTTSTTVVLYCTIILLFCTIILLSVISVFFFFRNACISDALRCVALRCVSDDDEQPVAAPLRFASTLAPGDCAMLLLSVCLTRN